MNKNINGIFKFIWLAMTVLCLLAAVHQTIHQGFSHSYMFFIMTALCLIMYLLRRFNKPVSE